MKIAKHKLWIAAGAAIASGVAGSSAVAQTTVTKDNNTTTLNLGGSWVGSAAPDSTKIALWDSTIDGTVTNANSAAVGAALSWGGIRVTNPAQAITISATSTNSLTINDYGIDLSNSNVNLTINAPVRTQNNQTWDLGSRSVTFGSTLQLAVTASSSSTVSLTSGTVIASGGNINMSQGATTNTALHLSGSSSLTVGNILLMGQGTGSTSALTISGSASLSTGAAIQIGAVNSSLAQATTASVVQEGTSTVSIGGNLTITRGNNSAVNNINGSYTLKGGTLTVGAVTAASGIVWGSTNGDANQVATFNLDGGIFRVGDLGTGIAQTNERFYFNGGQLEYTNNIDDTAIFGGANFNEIGVKSGGAKIKVVQAARTMTVASPLTATTGSTGGLVKSGPGKLLLQGHNTYIGNTEITEGNLEIAATGSLKLDVNDGSSTQVLGVAGGSESLTLKGGLRLDITDQGSPGSWQLIDDDLATTYDTGFNIALTTGETFLANEDGITWTYTNVWGTYTFTENDGLLITTAPEPGTVGVLLTGAMMLLRRRRRTLS